MIWLTANAIPLVLLLGGVVHTLIQLGEWKRKREAPPPKGISELQLLRALEASRQQVMAKCVSRGQWDERARSVDRRLEQLEQHVFGRR